MTTKTLNIFGALAVLLWVFLAMGVISGFAGYPRSFATNHAAELSNSSTGALHCQRAAPENDVALWLCRR
jgi:hypothetical protein